MLQFHPIQLEDQDWITKALRQSDFQGCEYSFANNYAWRRLGNLQVAQYEGFYIARSGEEQPVFSFPAGKGNLALPLMALAGYAVRGGFPLCIRGVTANMAELLEQAAPGQYTLTPMRDEFDYIYRVQDLIELRGKPYHAKRNHLNRFQSFGASFSPITPNDFDECIALSARFYNEKSGYTDASSVAEQFAIHTFFTNFERLGLQGGVLRISSQLVAFTLGEPINSDTYGIHIEKADTKYQGAYAAINQLFLQQAASSYTYVNREEDLGLEGLRRAKLSYHPAYLLEKAQAVFPHPESLIP